MEVETPRDSPTSTPAATPTPLRIKRSGVNVEYTPTTSKKAKVVLNTKKLKVNEVVTEDLMIPEMMENMIYHYTFQVDRFLNNISFGYCYKDKSSCDVINIIPLEGIRYEIVFDMINERMSINEGDNKEVYVCKISSTPVYPFIGAGNASVKYLGSWNLPLNMIRRYRIRGYHKTPIKDFQLAENTPIESCNVITYIKNSKQLYQYYRDNKIEYVVFNQLLQYEGVRIDKIVKKDRILKKDKTRETNKGSFSFKIQEDMKEGIYHFYYQIVNDYNDNINFGYYQNPDSSNEVPVLYGVPGRKGEIYEVIYDMNEKKMWIKEGNGREILALQSLPTLVYPCISIDDKKCLVKIIEYYKEKENYQLFNAVNVEDGKVIIHGINVPNTFYSIYNYEKYFWISQLLSIKSNTANINIEDIKTNILKIFELSDKQNDYLIKVNSLDDIIILLKCFDDEISEYLDLSDSFVNIVNSLNIVEVNGIKKYLDFSEANVKVFQFPMNRIYIRDCYYEMFRYICKIMSFEEQNSNILITGQPGIGKTSFIYVLLFFLKNNFLYYPFDENKKKYFEREELKKEIENITEQVSKITNISEILTRNHEQDIRTNYEMLKQIITNKKCIRTIKSSYKKEKEKFTITEFNESISLINNEKCLNYIKDTINIIKNGNDVYNISELIDMNDFDEYKSHCMDDSISFDIVVQGYLLALRIMKGIDDVEMFRILNISKEKEEKVNEMRIEDNTVYDDKIKRGLTHHIEDNKWKNNNKFKDIYVVKGKKNRNKDNNKKIYLLKDGYLCKINIETISINDSIIIVDTSNENFGSGNIVISVSSPDINNYERYRDSIMSNIELYFDSLNDLEINEWFDNCINFNKDDKFEEICERYGNIPRQIYYHYLYKENYKNRDYWEYYKKLIEGVIATSSYNDFIKKYMMRSNLEMDPLSNIITKYDLQPEFDYKLEAFILKPQNKLKYISDTIKNYIKFKLYPPKNKDEYDELNRNYSSFSDKYMKRMALKQIIAYELSINRIKIVCDPNFILDSKKEVCVYYPEDGWNFVYFLLDDNSYFDLIVDGVFIKVLLEDKELDDNEKFDKNNITDDIKVRMRKSIRDYSEKKVATFVCYALQKNKIKYCNRHFNICEDEEKKEQEEKKMEEEEMEEEEIVIEQKSYLMRKCFKDMLKIIYPDDINVDNNRQRNYLIFGNAKIGKSILAKIIVERLRSDYEYLRVDYILDGEIVPNQLDQNKSNYPYVVVADGGVIGEDDYSDAEMIIILANPCADNCKTFQSKRCPLLMYIPPFTKEEVEKVIKLAYGINHTADVIIEKYLDNYDYYGGIIGMFDKKKGIDIDTIISQTDKAMIDDVVKGIKKSALSKVDYKNIFIYETDDKDVTKCGNLRFISDTVRNLVCKKYYTIDSVTKCRDSMKVLLDNPTGSLAGSLYEKIFFYLMKECSAFKEYVFEVMKESNKLVKDIIVTVNKIRGKKVEKCKVVKIAEPGNENDLNNSIYEYDIKSQIINFINLSYNCRFPDIDALFGPFGVQITVAESHKYAPEMTMILQNLYRIYKNGYKHRVDYKEVNEELEYRYFFISPRKFVNCVRVYDRKTKSYPQCFQKLSREINDTKLEKEEKDRLYKNVEKKRIGITIPYVLLDEYLKKLEKKL